MNPIVRVSIHVYLGMIGLAFVVAALLGRSLPIGSWSSATAIAFDVLIGVAAAAVVVLISRFGIYRTRWGRSLALELGERFGVLTAGEITVLALLSGTGEELLFRGILQPYLGYVVTSLVFGLIHIGPGRVYLPWTGFAILAGFLFGGLVIWTGSLLPAILAHVLINQANFVQIGRLQASAGALTGRACVELDATD